MGNRATTISVTGAAQSPIAGNTEIELRRAVVSAGAYNALSEEKKAASCTILIDPEDTNVSDIHIQLKDRNGENIAYAWSGIILCTTTVHYTINAGSTGIAQHGSPVGGVIGAGLAKGAFFCTTNATGTLDLIYTDTGNAEAEVGVVLDGGYTIWSGDFAHDTA